MGAIHPRPKALAGTRLAAAARHVAYGHADAPWTGPVLKACTIKGGELALDFDETLLKGDALAVRRSVHVSTLPLDELARQSPAALEALLRVPGAAVRLSTLNILNTLNTVAGAAVCLHTLNTVHTLKIAPGVLRCCSPRPALESQTARQKDHLYTSPLEVQYGGTTLYDGVWLSASLRTKCLISDAKSWPFKCCAAERSAFGSRDTEGAPTVGTPTSPAAP